SWTCFVCRCDNDCDVIGHECLPDRCRVRSVLSSSRPLTRPKTRPVRPDRDLPRLTRPWRTCCTVGRARKRALTRPTVTRLVVQSEKTRQGVALTRPLLYGRDQGDRGEEVLTRPHCDTSS